MELKQAGEAQISLGQFDGNELLPRIFLQIQRTNDLVVLKACEHESVKDLDLDCIEKRFQQTQNQAYAQNDQA